MPKRTKLTAKKQADGTLRKTRKGDLTDQGGRDPVNIEGQESDAHDHPQVAAILPSNTTSNEPKLQETGAMTHFARMDRYRTKRRHQPGQINKTKSTNDNKENVNVEGNQDVVLSLQNMNAEEVKTRLLLSLTGGLSDSGANPIPIEWLARALGVSTSQQRSQTSPSPPVPTPVTIPGHCPLCGVKTSHSCTTNNINNNHNNNNVTDTQKTDSVTTKVARLAHPTLSWANPSSSLTSSFASISAQSSDGDQHSNNNNTSSSSQNLSAEDLTQYRDHPGIEGLINSSTASLPLRSLLRQGFIGDGDEDDNIDDSISGDHSVSDGGGAVSDEEDDAETCLKLTRWRLAPICESDHD